MIHPTLSKVLALTETGQAAWEVHMNMHQGKVGVLCLAPAEGMGVTDHAMRERVGGQLHRFRNSA
jgi:crotonyl-CoA reductase